jgi:hypothetical protein
MSLSPSDLSKFNKSDPDAFFSSDEKSTPNRDRTLKISLLQQQCDTACVAIDSASFELKQCIRNSFQVII